MIRYLLQRPIAVLMSFGAVLLFGLAALRQLPISLLPPIDVPRILVRVSYPNTPAAALEQNAVTPIRENLLTTNGLRNITSKTANHAAVLQLEFEYNTRMDLAFIEVNEKLDRLGGMLPREMPRPQVQRINTSDIPIIRLQVTPRDPGAYSQVSELAEKTIKRRLEQLPGVSVVDLNGSRGDFFEIRPKDDVLQALRLDRRVLEAAIRGANAELGNLSVRDGQYRYFVRVGNTLQSPQDVAGIPIALPGGTPVPLGRLATVAVSPQTPTGYHLYNGREALALTIQKQPNARMTKLAPAIEALAAEFRRDYPYADFAFTQDQNYLLKLSINNLSQSLWLGGALAVLALFFFLGNYASPLLMGLSIPISLVLTFVLFYALGVSVNIISLSGLALGLGMLIDNAIIVIDNITRKRRTGLSMLDSAATGTVEVTAPILGQVLTTVAVYAPLVLLSGLAGALISDQAIALTISLGVSLLVAFILAPSLYRLLLRKDVSKLREDTRFFRWVLAGYHALVGWVFRHKLIASLAAVCLGGAGIWLAVHAPTTALPQIKKTETQLAINWNAPIDAAENLRRIKELDAFLASEGAQIREAEVGISQFLLQQEDPAIAKALVYAAYKTPEDKARADARAARWLARRYPAAIAGIGDAPNAFTQLFSSSAPYLEARFQAEGAAFSAESASRLGKMLEKLPSAQWQKDAGLQEEPSIDLIPKPELLAEYRVPQAAVEEALNRLFGQTPISEIKRFGDIKTLRFEEDRAPFYERLEQPVQSLSGQAYPLKLFLDVQYASQFKFITSGKTGEYKAVHLFETPRRDIPGLQRQIDALARENGFTVEYAGRYFDNQSNTRRLLFIFLISIGLLYFVLAIEFENLLHPLLVMSTLPLGLFGSFLLLRLFNAPVDVMAAIGLVVVLGIITDDPILKVHTINRLRKAYALQGMGIKEALERAIHDAGEICLKPVLMTSITTVLGLLPVLFMPGLGSELQRTLVLVIAGGLTLGTFNALWFIPLAYWATARR